MEKNNQHMLLLSDVMHESYEEANEGENAVESFGMKDHKANTAQTSDCTTEFLKTRAQQNNSVQAINPFNSVTSVGGREKSLNTNDSNNSQAIREHIRQAAALQDALNLEEIKLCNDLIERLKQENAQLEHTVMDQRTEIQNLTERANEWQLNASQKLSNMDKKEIESIVRRLREDLEKTKHDRKEKDLQIEESGQVIAKLQGQLRELKQRMATKDDISRSEHHMIIGQKAKDLDEMRKEKEMITKKYQDLAEVIKQKEIEILEVENKSKRMLQIAQKDAEECITYFKELAFSKINESDYIGVSASKIKRKSRSREKEQFSSNITFNPAFSMPINFPSSLAPVTNSTSVRNIVTQASPKHFSVAGKNNLIRDKLSRKEAEKGQRTKSSYSKQLQFEIPTSTKKDKRSASLSPALQSSSKKFGKTAPLRRPVETYIEDFDVAANEITATQEQLSQNKLEIALNSLSRAFMEIAETKAGIFSFVESYQESYCEQMQKFSVLAYDYIERIDNLSKREMLLDEKIRDQQEKVDGLKMVTFGQTEHIKIQSTLIFKLKNALRERNDTWDRLVQFKDNERERILKLCYDEFPIITKGLENSTKSIEDVFENKIQNSQELQELRSAHQMLKSKVKILKEELEKALLRNKANEEIQITERTKSDRLADLIKDIWIAEVQQGTPQVGGQFATMASFNAGGMISGRGTNTNRVAATITPGSVNQLEPLQQYQQTINSAQAAYQPYILVPDVPMPISWLSDIADHIKQLKEMNDFQRDEVYQLLNILSKNEGAAALSNPSISALSGKSYFSAKERAIQLIKEQESSTDGYGISENDPESTQNNNVSHEKEETELSERISEHNLKIIQQNELNSSNIYDRGAERFQNFNKKEMSFSHRLSDDQVSTESDQGQIPTHEKRRGLSANYRPLNSATASKRKQTTFANDARSFSHDRQKQQAQYIEKSRNSSGIRLKDNSLKFGKKRVEQTNTQQQLYFATEFSPRPMIQSKSRSPLFKRTQFSTSPGLVSPHYVDSTKRNELYSMLHDEVFAVMRQVQVGKETIFQMKQLIKKREKTIKECHSEINNLSEQKQQIETQLARCAGDLKQQQADKEELHLVIEDKEEAIKNLKAQIEEFEKELHSLQDQIMHVMKMIAEISASSEHWEKSYNNQVEANQITLAQQEADFKQSQKQMQEKLNQFKKKLAEKDLLVRENVKHLEDAQKYIQRINQVKMTAMSVATNTGPEFELIEKQNQALKEQLTQVKDDIAAVLDQYESEQVNNKTLNEQLNSERTTNGSLIYELNKTRMDKQKLFEQIQQQQDEVKQLKNALEQDQFFYKQQMEHAQEINDQLQQQVEAVTQLTEELQDQIALTSRSNNELVQKTEQAENQRRYQEQRIQNYVRQITESNDIIQQLQSKIDRIKSQKRESRSFSISKTHNKRQLQHSAMIQDEEVAGQSQINEVQKTRITSVLSEGSKRSKSTNNNRKIDFRSGTDYEPIRKQSIGSKNQNTNNKPTSKNIVIDKKFEATLQTSSSIFDEDNEAEVSAALDEEKFQVTKKNFKPVNLSNNASASNQIAKDSNKGVKNNNQVECHDLHAQREIYKRQKQSKNPLRRRKRADRSISPITQNTQQNSTHTGNTGITGLVSTFQTQQQSESSNCCCQNSFCRNKTTKELPSINEPIESNEESSIIITQESTFREQVYQKNQITQYAKKKVKKVTKMIEDLVRHYCIVAKDKNDIRMLAQGRFINQDPNSSMLSSTQEANDLERQLANWNTESNDKATATEKKQRRDKAFKEAKLYFDKRSPTFVACLSTLAENYNPTPAPMIFEQPIKQNKSNKKLKKKDPPEIISSRIAKGEVDLQCKNCSYIETETEISDKLGGKSHRQKSLNNSALMNNNDPYQRGFSGKRNGSSSTFEAVKQNQSRNNSSQLKDDFVNTVSNGTKITSPNSSNQQATGTFRVSSQYQELLVHCRLLFSKFVQLGRSLAGICYGGCIFMGQNALDKQRQQVDFALQFLAKESTEVDSQSKLQFEETVKVVEGLISIISSFLSSSCQNLLRANENKQQFDSIAKSIDFSIDQNPDNSLSQDLQSKNHRRNETSNFQQVNQSSAQTSVFISNHLKERLLEVEQKIKQKFTHINQLEQSLDAMLNLRPQKQSKKFSNDQPSQSIEALCQDPFNLQKILMNIKRAISKLKIELHSDYLMLGQINIQCQSSRDQSQTLLGTEQTMGQQILQNAIQNFATVGSFAPSLYGNAFSNAVQSVTQEPEYLNFQQQYSRADQTQSQHQIASYNLSNTHSQNSSQKLRSQGFNQKQSQCSGISMLQSTGTISNQQVANLQRQGSSTSSTNTQLQNHAIDRIVEELKGLTFEH